VPSLHDINVKPPSLHSLLYTFIADYFNSFLMIGRVGERRTTSLNPARMKAAGMPVQVKAGGISLSDLGSTG